MEITEYETNGRFIAMAMSTMWNDPLEVRAKDHGENRKYVKKKTKGVLKRAQTTVREIEIERERDR